MSNEISVIGDNLLIDCDNCILRVCGQCYKDKPIGECNEIKEFVNNLMIDKEKYSVEEFQERYQLYMLRMENMSEYKEIQRLRKEIDDGDVDSKEKEYKINTLKMFWMRSNELILKGLGRILDRESGISKGVTIKNLNLTHIHKLVNEHNDK